MGLTRISLSNAPQTGAGAASYYGSFFDTTAQTILSPLAETLITYNNTVFNNGVSIASGSQIVFNNAGKYNIEFSLQLVNKNGQEREFYLWLKYLSNPVAWSASVITVPKQHALGNGHLVPSWNFFVDVNAGDNCELAWTATSTQVSIEKLTPPAGYIPNIPSVILTVNKIS